MGGSFPHRRIGLLLCPCLPSAGSLSAIIHEKDMEISASLQAKSRLQHAAAAQGKQLDEAIRAAKDFAARVAESLHLDSVTQELAAEDELDMKMVHDQLTQELKERLISSATREKQGDLTSTSVSAFSLHCVCVPAVCY